MSHLYISVSDPLHFHVESNPRIHFRQLQIRIRSNKFLFFLIIFVKDMLLLLTFFLVIYELIIHVYLTKIRIRPNDTDPTGSGSEMEDFERKKKNLIVKKKFTRINGYHIQKLLKIILCILAY